MSRSMSKSVAIFSELGFLAGSYLETFNVTSAPCDHRNPVLMSEKFEVLMVNKKVLV